MRYLLLFLFLGPGLAPPMQAQSMAIYVSELSNQALDTVAANTFFLCESENSPKRRRLRKNKYNALRLGLKFSGPVDSLVNRISAFHQAAPQITQQGGQTHYFWHGFPEPRWFFSKQNLHLEVEARDGYHLLLFYHAYELPSRWGKIRERNAISSDFGQLMVQAYRHHVQALSR